MLNLQELDASLRESGAAYELIHQAEPIRSAQDGAKYYDIRYAAPTFIVQTDRGLMALIARASRGRLDFAALREQLGLGKLKLADRKKAEAATGCTLGAVPLIGTGLPCIFDESLLDFPHVFGGSGDELVTLKIAPADVKRLNDVALCLPR